MPSPGTGAAFISFLQSCLESQHFFFRLLHLHYNFLLLGPVHSIKHRIRHDVKKNTIRDCIAFCAAIADY